MPTMRSRSSTVANSMVILPLFRPMSTLTRVSKRSESRSARSVSAGACTLRPAGRCGLLRRAVRDRQRDEFLGGPDRETFGDDAQGELFLLRRCRPARAGPGRARRRALRRRPGAAPAPAGSAGGSCWRSAGGCGRSGGASSSCVAPNSSSSCWYAAASSSGFRLARWMFSSSASRSIASSWVSRMIAGMLSLPTAWAARQRRSPMTSSYRPSPISRTTIGCRKPTSWIETLSSSRASSSKTCRGCLAFGSMADTGSSAKRAPGTGASSCRRPESARVGCHRRRRASGG